MITTEQIKALREQTGVSIMQCKKALEEAEGNAEKALIILKKKGGEIAAKKSDREAHDGTVVVREGNGKAVITVLHCETDFVAKNEDFVTAAHKLADIAFEQGEDAAREAATEIVNAVVLKIGEKIELGSIETIEGPVIGAYGHHTGRNAVVVVLSAGDSTVAKDIAMHTAAMKPTYITREEIPASAVDTARELFAKEVAESGKPEDIQKKMLQGKLDAYFQEQTLLDQPFFKNPDMTIGQLLEKNGATIVSVTKKGARIIHNVHHGYNSILCFPSRIRRALWV